jgi:hypothetical protein
MFGILDSMKIIHIDFRIDFREALLAPHVRLLTARLRIKEAARRLFNGRRTLPWKTMLQNS